MGLLRETSRVTETYGTKLMPIVFCNLMQISSKHGVCHMVVINKKTDNIFQTCHFFGIESKYGTAHNTYTQTLASNCVTSIILHSCQVILHYIDLAVDTTLSKVKAQ